MMNKSLSISRFIGRKSGTYPAYPLLAFECDRLMNAYVPVFEKIYECLMCPDLEERPKMLKQCFSKIVPEYLATIEDKLSTS